MCESRKRAQLNKSLGCAPKDGRRIEQIWRSNCATRHVLFTSVKSAIFVGLSALPAESGPFRPPVAQNSAEQISRRPTFVRARAVAGSAWSRYDLRMELFGVLEPVTENIWVRRDAIQILSMPLTATMTVVRQESGRLLIYSPVACTSEVRAAVEALGPVTDLYAPNTFHHKYMGDWIQAYPQARVHAPSGLATKRPDLRIDRHHDQDGDVAIETSFDEVQIAGFLLEETALFHRKSGSLLVADLVHNIGRPPQWWTRFYAGLMGFYGQVAISRMIRWTAFHDKAAARRSLDRLLALPIQRIIVGHGAVVTAQPVERLADAYRWLKADGVRLVLPAPKKTGCCG